MVVLLVPADATVDIKIDIPEPHSYIKELTLSHFLDNLTDIAVGSHHPHTPCAQLCSNPQLLLLPNVAADSEFCTKNIQE